MKNKNSEIENKNNSKNTDATSTNEINLAIDSTRQKQEKAKLEQAAKEQHQIEYQSYTQGLKNTCNVIHRIIDGAFKILYTTDRNATSYTLIDNTFSAVIQYVESSQKKDTATPDQDNDIIQDYINKNIQNSETANNTVKYHIQRIATHVLCYLFKHFSVHQIISADYRGCYDPEELEKLMQQTDANGVALYFKVVSKYFVDHETHKIIDGDLLRHTRTNNGLSLLKWQRESNDVFTDELTEEPLLLHLIKTNKEGELEKTEGKTISIFTDHHSINGEKSQQSIYNQCKTCLNNIKKLSKLFVITVKIKLIIFTTMQRILYADHLKESNI